MKIAIPSIYFRNEDAVEAVPATPNISSPMTSIPNQQEMPQSKEISVTDDCSKKTDTPTFNLNTDPIIDYKYAYMNHDDEDVQQNTTSFMDVKDSEPKVLCKGEICS